MPKKSWISIYIPVLMLLFLSFLIVHPLMIMAVTKLTGLTEAHADGLLALLMLVLMIIVMFEHDLSLWRRDEPGRMVGILFRPMLDGYHGRLQSGRRGDSTGATGTST